jgi:hypothetical protein
MSAAGGETAYVMKATVAVKFITAVLDEGLLHQ